MVKKETLFLNGSVILLSSPLSASIAPSVTPECLYEGSTVFKSLWIPD